MQLRFYRTKSTFCSNYRGVEPALYSTELKNKKIEDKEIFTLSTGGYNPVISSLDVNYKNRSVTFEISEKLMSYMKNKDTTSQKKNYSVDF